MSSKRILASFLAIAPVVVVQAVGSCDSVDQPATKPDVVVQRLEGSAGGAAGSCWQTLWPDGAAEGEFGLQDFCEGGSVAGGNVGAGDQLRVLISYANVYLTPGADAPVPTIVETVDGVAVDAGASVSTLFTGLPGQYMATLPVPLQSPATLEITVDVVSGYGFTVPQAFAVAPPAIALGLAYGAGPGAGTSGGVYAVDAGSCQAPSTSLATIPVAVGSTVELRVTAPGTLVLSTAQVTTVVFGAAGVGGSSSSTSSSSSSASSSSSSGTGGASSSGTDAGEDAAGGSGGSGSGGGSSTGAAAITATFVETASGQVEATVPLTVPEGAVWEINVAVGAGGELVTRGCFLLPSE
jgi:hypothetical protein